jgi:transcriptional regulator with XRE-family HTH domain
MEKVNKRFPNKLRQYRKDLCLEQKSVLRLLGSKNNASLSSWENGTRMPSGVYLMKLCIIYSKTPIELYPKVYKTLQMDLSDKMK